MRKIELKDGSIDKEFGFGYESTIYYYNDDSNYDHVVLFKKFNDLNHDNPEFLKNKENKLLLIPQIDELKDDVKVLDLVYKEGKLVGYTMEKSSNTPIDMFDKRKNKIRFLKILRAKIEILNQQDIYIGDFNEKNFLTSDEKDIIELCDLDNLRIGKYDFDVMDNVQKKFMNRCGNISLIDSYCFNIFTISFLGKFDMAYLFNHLDWNHFPKILYCEENEQLFQSMICLNNEYERKFLIDKIKAKSLF